MEAENIIKAASFKNFLHVSYENAQLLFHDSAFNRLKNDNFGGGIKIWVARFL